MNRRRQIWRSAAGCETKERDQANVVVVLIGKTLDTGLGIGTGTGQSLRLLRQRTRGTVRLLEVDFGCFL